MSEKEIVKDDKPIDDKPLEEKPEEAVEPSQAEIEARKLGWKPENEYEGEEGKWIGAEEFISRAPLYEKNRKLSKKLKELESTVNLLSEHNKKVEESAYKRALETLKSEKVKALDEGDHKAVAEIDDQILELKTDKKPEQEKPRNEEFNEWVSKNQWYEKDDEMRDFADFAGARYAAKNKGADPEDVYRYAEKQVMERFPEKFRNPNKARPSSVEGGSRSATKSKLPSWGDLPEVFQTVGNKFVRQGVMTKEEYIKQLVETGSL